MLSDFACFLLRLKHVEGVSGCGSAVHAEDKDRRGGSGFGDALVALIKHRLDFAIVGSGENDIADFERAVLHEHGGNVAPSFVEARLDYGAYGLAVGVGLEVEQLSFKQHFFHELVDSEAFWRICPGF